LKNKLKVKSLIRTAKEVSDEMFWAAAAHARDPIGSFKITQEIDKAIRAHESNVRKHPGSNPV
jgi:hypothetical protein